MGLGNFSIDQECFDKIREILPSGTILELGSGFATGELAKYYTMYSIEHDEQFVGKYDSNYIYAPLVDGWYDVDKLILPKYDLILVDGPPAVHNKWARLGFHKHLLLFNTDVPIIMDDVHRSAEYAIAHMVSDLVGRKVQIFGTKKRFAVI